MDDYLQLYSEKLQALEAIVRRLLEGRFASARDLWQIQDDLIKYQVSLQESIHEEKSAQEEMKATIEAIVLQKPDNWKLRNQELYEQIELKKKSVVVCKHLHKLSRQFGDALAWLFLKLDEKLITSLTRNQPIGFTSEKHALTGVLAIAEAFSKAGAGFPVIHDMTNILRIGDITFIVPDDEPMTVEVKSHLEGQEGDILDLQVEVHTLTKSLDTWDRIQLNIQTATANDQPNPPDSLSRRELFKPNARLERQLERMRHAKIWQDTEAGKPIDIPGFRGLIASVEVRKDSYHVDFVRELAAKAKNNCYAGQVTNDGLLYVAMYIDNPTAYGWPFHLEIPDVPNRRSLLDGLNARSVFMSGHTWDHIKDDTPPYVRPFFLYSLPSDMIIDMMWGRLGIFVFVDISQLIETARKAGHDLALGKPTTIAGIDSVPEVTKLEVLEDGQSIIGVIGAHYYKKMLYEFLSVKGFLDYLSEIANVKEGLPTVPT